MREQICIIKNIKDFEPKHTFECGQCFRWNKEDDGSYTGIVGNNVLNVKKEQNDIVVKSKGNDDIDEVCNKYFDIDTNYEDIKSTLSKIDDDMKKSIEYGSGIRILKQDSWEALISFIISANNNIPRIKGIIERISEKYGKKIEWNNRKYYTFPTPEELANASVKDLRLLGLGFRDARVFETTQMVKENKIDLANLEKIQDINILREELLKFPGVGPKVADCIMLFSMKKYDVFPIDVWVKRVTTELYGNEIWGNTTPTANISNKKILELANRKFGKLSGIAQQYLFYYRRNSNGDF